MHSFSHWFLTEAVPAFGRTLLHSLWQGLSAAVLAGAVILATRKTTASKRYYFLVAVYSLFIAAVALTFFRELGWMKAAAAPPTGLPVPIGTVLIVESGAPTHFSFTGGFGSRFVAFVNQNAGIIVALWALFFVVQLVRMASGLRYVKEVRQQGTVAVTGHWADWIEKASRRLGIRPCVALLQSERVHVPVVLGFLRPVVLVPIGLLANLDTHQVEAVLLHELAHIRRHDYLINLAQSFADAVFAFNPAVRWLSARIREERESCCDEIAVRHTGNEKGYVEALVSFSESPLLPSYAMAIGSNKMQLLNRVKTIITRENNRLTAKEQVILVLGLLMIISLAAFSFKPKEDITKREPSSGKGPASVNTKSTAISLQTKPVPKGLPFSSLKPATDTVPSPATKRTEPIKWKSLNTNMTDDGEGKTTQVLATEANGTVYRLRKAGDEIVLLSVNGQEIAKEDYPKYRSVIDALEQARRQRETAALKKQEGRMAALQREQQLLAQKLAMNDAKKSEALQAQQQALTRELSVLNETTKALQKQRLTALQREQQRLTQKLVLDDKRRAETFQSQQQALTREESALNEKIQGLLQQQAYEAYKADSLHQLQRYKTYKQHKLESYQAYKETPPSNDAIASIIQELKAAALVQNESKLSFHLTNTGLEVDGKAVDAATFEKFRKKYIKNSGDSFQYFRDGGTTRTTISLQ